MDHLKSPLLAAMDNEPVPVFSRQKILSKRNAKYAVT
jgi:hypothetical protein